MATSISTEPNEGVDEELDRRVDPAWPAPDADEEVHRQQHHFPHHVEEEEVERAEDAEQSRFQKQEQGEVGLHALLDPERVDEAQDPKQAGQEDQRQAQTVNTEEVVDVEDRDPAAVLDVLHPLCDGRLLRDRELPRLVPGVVAPRVLNRLQPRLERQTCRFRVGRFFRTGRLELEQCRRVRTRILQQGFHVAARRGRNLRQSSGDLLVEDLRHTPLATVRVVERHHGDRAESRDRKRQRSDANEALGLLRHHQKHQLHLAFST